MLGQVWAKASQLAREFVFFVSFCLIVILHANLQALFREHGKSAWCC